MQPNPSLPLLLVALLVLAVCASVSHGQALPIEPEYEAYHGPSSNSKGMATAFPFAAPLKVKRNRTMMQMRK